MTGLGAQRAGLALMLAFSAVACEQDSDDGAGLAGPEAAAESRGETGLITTREDVEWVQGQDGERLASLVSTAMFWQQRIAEAATEEQRDALAGLALKTMTEQEVPR